jgi:hypothetical protein
VTWGDTPVDDSVISRVKWSAPIAPSLVVGTDQGNVVVFRPLDVKYASMPNILTLEETPSLRIRTPSETKLKVSVMSGGRTIQTVSASGHNTLWYRDDLRRDKYRVVYENTMSSNRQNITSTCISDDGRLVAFVCDTKIYLQYRMSEDNFPSERILRRGHEIRLKFPKLDFEDAERLLRKEFERDMMDSSEKELRRIFQRKPRDARYGEIELKHIHRVTSASWRPTSTPSTGRNQFTSDLRARLFGNALLVTTSTEVRLHLLTSKLLFIKF